MKNKRTSNLLNKDIRLLICARPPTSGKSAGKLLAKLRYYRDFIPNFDNSIKYIKETTTNNSIFTWSEEAQEELDFIQWIFNEIHQEHISERSRHG